MTTQVWVTEQRHDIIPSVQLIQFYMKNLPRCTSVVSACKKQRKQCGAD